jgi:hypothetical protein
MINQYLIEPFARSYRSFDTHNHAITDEVVRSTLRQRVGLRLIHLGETISGPTDERAAA